MAKKDRFLLVPPIPAGKGVTITADKIELDLSQETVLQAIAPSIIEGFATAVRNTRAKPAASTIERRGPGAFFNVSGRFLGSLLGHQARDGWELRGIMTPRLRGWLFKRVASARPQRVLEAMVKKWGKAVSKAVVIVGGKLSQTGQLVK